MACYAIIRTCGLLFAAALAAGAGPAAAHPLGNNTVNRQAAISVAPARVAVDYRMDLAEIPTLAAEALADGDADGLVDIGEWSAHARRWAEQAAAGLYLEADGLRLPLAVVEAGHAAREGEAGLRVLMLHARLEAALPPPGARRVAYEDRFRLQERGWREIWMRGEDGVKLSGAVAMADRSRGLTAYPQDAAPLDELVAAVSVHIPATPPAATGAEAASWPAPMAAAAGAVPAPRPPAPEAATPSSAPTASPDLSSMFELGAHHILVGFDHLAFLAGLLLLAPGWMAALRLATAFTIAHSITLFLAATGRVPVLPEMVEPAIALTVAAVGGLALLRRGAAHGAPLAFAFGLVHGLGFAGALAETLGSLRTGGAVAPLLAFNLGIEACQVVLVSLALAAVHGVRRAVTPAALHTSHRLAAFAVLTSGLGWALGRL